MIWVKMARSSILSIFGPCPSPRTAHPTRLATAAPGDAVDENIELPVPTSLDAPEKRFNLVARSVRTAMSMPPALVTISAALPIISGAVHVRSSAPWCSVPCSRLLRPPLLAHGYTPLAPCKVIGDDRYLTRQRFTWDSPTSSSVPGVSIHPLSQFLEKVLCEPCLDDLGSSRFGTSTYCSSDLISTVAKGN